MKNNSLTALIFLSSVMLAACGSDATYEDGQKAYKDGNIDKAIEIWKKAALKKSDDASMYALYSLYQTNPNLITFEESIGWLHQAADAGRPEAQYKMGLFLIEHNRFIEGYDYIDKAAKWNDESAIKLLKKNQNLRAAQISAEKEEPKGMYDYASIILSDDDTKNNDEGINLARKAAMTGLPEAEFLYGKVLYEKLDYNGATIWFQKASEHNYPLGDYYLSLMTLYGQANVRNPAKSLTLLKNSAEKNCVEALVRLGEIYINGSGEYNILPDLKNGVNYLEKAVELKSPEATYILAGLYEEGKGVPQDHKKSISLLSESASSEYEPAIIRIAEIFLINGGDTKERALAISLLTNLVESKNSVKANTLLGIAYKNGLGVEVDNAKAIKYLQAGVDAKNSIAAYNLALMIFNGNGTEYNFEKVIEYLDLAASNGFKPAMYALIAIYESDKNPNEIRSKFWRQRLALMGERSINNQLNDARKVLNITK
ncbi:MAG: hypothetical protein ACI4V7_01695 [Succinivibrionaceae bacterium]